MLRLALLLALLGVSVGCDGTTGTLVTLPKARMGSPSVQEPTAEGGARPPSPAPGTAWEIQLSGALDTSYAVPWYEVDAFDTDESAIAALHAQGRTVSCYVSVGTDETWRADSVDFPASAVGNALADYSNERWLDVRDPTVRSVNQRRLVLAAGRGCDAVELSNVEAHTADSGFPLTAADDLAYARFLLGVAHTEGCTPECPPPTISWLRSRRTWIGGSPRSAWPTAPATSGDRSSTPARPFS